MVGYDVTVGGGKVVTSCGRQGGVMVLCMLLLTATSLCLMLAN